MRVTAIGERCYEVFKRQGYRHHALDVVTLQELCHTTLCLCTFGVRPDSDMARSDYLRQDDQYEAIINYLLEKIIEEY